MTPPPPLYHALLRPAVLQILRATGYHGAKTSVLDSVTDLAARYFLHLCHLTALYATHNNTYGTEPPLLLPPASHLFPGPPTTTTAAAAAITASDQQQQPQQQSQQQQEQQSQQQQQQEVNTTATAPAAAPPTATLNPVVPAPTLVDVRMALQRAGALLPERLAEEQEYLGEEDTRGVDGFVAWATGALNREIVRIALDGNDEAGDYLDALKKKHSKNDDDSKYLGTLLGRSIEYGDVLVEGGEWPSIFAWEERRKLAGQRTPEPEPLGVRGGQNGVDGSGDGDGDDEDSRPPSSGLSSLGDRSIADEMDLS